MLVLGRKLQEAVIVHLPDGREIRVVLVSAAGGQARLGFEAPQDIEIAREELTFRRYVRSTKSPAT